MTTDLANVELEEMSLVDRPACPQAKVVLVKHDNERAALVSRVAEYLGVDREAPPNVEEAGPMAKQDEAGTAPGTQKDEGAELRTRVEKLEAENAELKKAAEETKASTEKATARKAFRSTLPKALQSAFDEMDEEEQDSFMGRQSKAEKSDPIAKALAVEAEKRSALEVKLAKMEEDQLRKSFTEKHPGLPEAVAGAYFHLVKSDTGLAEELVEQVKALTTQVEKGELFKVAGKDGAGDKSPIARLEKIAGQLKATMPELTKEQAMTKAIELNPGLYTEFETERMVG